MDFNRTQEMRRAIEAISADGSRTLQWWFYAIALSIVGSLIINLDMVVTFPNFPIELGDSDNLYRHAWNESMCAQYKSFGRQLLNNTLMAGINVNLNGDITLYNGVACHLPRHVRILLFVIFKFSAALFGTYLLFVDFLKVRKSLAVFGAIAFAIGVEISTAKSPIVRALVSPTYSMAFHLQPLLIWIVLTLSCRFRGIVVAAPLSFLVAYAYQSVSLYAFSFWGFGLALLWMLAFSRAHVLKTIFLLMCTTLGFVFAEIDLISFMKSGIIAETLRTGNQKSAIELFDPNIFLGFIIFSKFKLSFLSGELSLLVLALCFVFIAVAYFQATETKTSDQVDQPTAYTLVSVLVILVICVSGTYWKYPLGAFADRVLGLTFFKSANYYGLVFAALPNVALITVFISRMSMSYRRVGVIALLGLIVVAQSERLYRQFVYYGAGHSFRQTIDSQPMKELAEKMAKERLRAVSIIQNDHAYQKFNKLLPRLFTWPLWGAGGQTADGFSQMIMKSGWDVYSSLNKTNSWSQMWQIEFPISDELSFDPDTNCLIQHKPIRLGSDYDLTYLAFGNVGYVISYFQLESIHLDLLSPEKQLPEKKRCGRLSSSAVREFLGTNETIPIHIYRLKTESPRFFVADKIVEVDNPDRVIERMRKIPSVERPRAAVIARSEMAEGSLPGRMAEPGNPSIEVVEDRPDRIKLRLNLQNAGLVVARYQYSRFWSVSVDGTASRLLPVNRASMGTLVPPGSHEVVFRYIKPPLFE